MYVDLAQTKVTRTSKFSNILIVDDNPVDGYLMKSSLEELDGTENVLLFERASDVMMWLRNGTAFKPDLVILDVNLHKENGFDLIDELHENDLLATDTPVMITSSQFNRRTEEMLNRVPGFSLFLHKPIQPTYLQGLVS